MSEEQPEKSIWQLQAELQAWHEAEYKQAYPGSEFVTGRTLAAQGRKSWDELTPQEQEERKERIAYHLNQMLFTLGVNISDNFRQEKP